MTKIPTGFELFQAIAESEDLTKQVLAFVERLPAYLSVAEGALQRVTDTTQRELADTLLAQIARDRFAVEGLRTMVLAVMGAHRESLDHRLMATPTLGPTH